MKIFIIGGTGQIGSFLVPELVEQGYEVFVGIRGITPRKSYASYEKVSFIKCDATNSEDLKLLRKYEFDVVIDIPGTAWLVWNALNDCVNHIIACGSLWMFGCPQAVPTPEIPYSESPFPVYVHRFREIQAMIEHSGSNRAVFTAIMPPNICGPGRIPIDCLGGRSIEIHKAHMQGESVILPDGPECIISPCDAEDIAHLFALAANNKEAAAGQMFNVGPEYGVTASQLVEIYSEVYGVRIPIERVSWETYIKDISPDIGYWWHFYAHMAPDISKAKNLLGYQPKYTPKQTIKRAVDWMKEEGYITNNI